MHSISESVLTRLNMTYVVSFNIFNMHSIADCVLTRLNMT